jgi:hypothetical protein
VRSRPVEPIVRQHTDSKVSVPAKRGTEGCPHSAKCMCDERVTLDEHDCGGDNPQNL